MLASASKSCTAAALGGLKVRGVAAGLAHTVACTDSGDVYSWGWNADGQLGLGDDQSRGEPELVADPLLEDSHIEQVMQRSPRHVAKSGQKAGQEDHVMLVKRQQHFTSHSEMLYIIVMIDDKVNVRL